MNEEEMLRRWSTKYFTSIQKKITQLAGVIRNTIESGGVFIATETKRTP